MKQRDQTVLMKIMDYCLQIKETHTGIPWKMIMRMRDLVAHHYGNLDYEIVWNTSVSDIPQLYHEIEEMLKTEQLA